MMINELAAELVMDRTTLRRNNLPLEREGLISIVRGLIDRHRHLVACGQNFVLAAIVECRRRNKSLNRDILLDGLEVIDRSRIDLSRSACGQPPGPARCASASYECIYSYFKRRQATPCSLPGR